MRNFTAGLFPGRLFPSGTQNISGVTLMDWGHQNLIAYASNTYIVIVEPVSLQIFQTLDQHQFPLSVVKWCVPHETEGKSHLNLCLASGDIKGNIFIWDVHQSTIVRSFHENAQILQLEWVNNTDLLVLFPRYLVLFNAENGSTYWKKELNHEVTIFSINPFDSQTVFCCSSGIVYLATGTSNYYQPSIYDKFQLPQTQSSSSLSSSTKLFADKQGINRSQIIQLFHYSATEGILLIASRSHIFVVDLRINQVVGVQDFQRKIKSPLIKLIECKHHPELLFCLHQNGSVSSWNLNLIEFTFEFKTSWELQPFSMKNKKCTSSIVTFANGRLQHETKLVLLSSNGELWGWDYKQTAEKASFGVTRYLETLTSVLSSISVKWFFNNNEGYQLYNQVALGTQSGTVQILDLDSKLITRELIVCKSPLRDIKWVNFHTLIAFSTEEIDGRWKNLLYLINIESGDMQVKRTELGLEAHHFVGLEISPSRNYFVVYFSDPLFEVWSLSSFSLIRSVPLKNSQFLAAVGWSPPVNSTNSEGVVMEEERFVVVAEKGNFHHFSLFQNSVQRSYIHNDPEIGNVISIAWKGKYMVTGDRHGNLRVWNFDLMKGKRFSTSLGPVLQIKFSPSARYHHIFVLFKDGEFGIWDIDHNIKVGNSSFPRGKELKTVFIDWIGEYYPIVATSDGCIRVFDRSLSVTDSAVNIGFYATEGIYTNPLSSPYVLHHSDYQILRALLLQNKYNSFISIFTRKYQKSDRPLLLSLPSSVLSSLLPSPDNNNNNIDGDDNNNTLERYKSISKYFGDEKDLNFWILIEHSLKLLNARENSKYSKSLRRKKKGNPNNDETKSLTNELLTRSDENNSNSDSNEVEKKELDEEVDLQYFRPKLLTDPPEIRKCNLLPHFDLLRPKSELKQEELFRANLHYKKFRDSYEYMKRNVNSRIILDQKRTAINLLLETPPTNRNFLLDSFKACIIAASESKESFENTMKTVACSLIEKGELYEGVQLLLLVQLGFEACKYLQAHGRWKEAAVLAKTTLNNEEYYLVFVNWANELRSKQRFNEAINIFVVLGLYHEVIQLLFESKQYQRATLFFQILLEKKILVIVDRNLTFTSKVTPSPSLFPLMPVLQLQYEVYWRYASYLIEIGLAELAEEICAASPTSAALYAKLFNKSAS